jgi:stage II sporulation protein AA (anti-sigma F factor antagonist)
MTIQEDRQDGVVIVAPIGRVDSTTSAALDKRLLALVAAGERRLVVDFAGVDYISSAGLRVLLTLAKKLKDAPGSLALCAMGDSVREVFSLAGFMPLFAVEPTRAAAVTRLAGR